MKALIFIICFSLIFTGCKKNPASPYQSEGTLIGYDYRMCAECGGLKITIKNDIAENPSAFYLIDTTLQKPGISESEIFPIPVTFNWQHNMTQPGAFHYILVSQLKVIR
jgi:hypothetical protein